MNCDENLNDSGDCGEFDGYITGTNAFEKKVILCVCQNKISIRFSGVCFYEWFKNKHRKMQNFTKACFFQF